MQAQYHEFPKYLEHCLTLYGNLAVFLFDSDNPTFFGIEVGPMVAIPTQGNTDVVAYGHYGISIGLSMHALNVAAEFAGVVSLDRIGGGDGADFMDSRSYSNSVAFGAQWTSHTIQPGVFYEMYLGDETLRGLDFFDSIVGFKVNMTL